MRKWECGSVCPRAPIFFHPPSSFTWRGGVGDLPPPPSVCNMPQAENHPINWAEGRALHAAEPTVIVSGKKAVAAMTCPGVPTHRKRLRPAERVETESATYAECLSRSGSGGHGQRRGRVAAHYRLSAPGPCMAMVLARFPNGRWRLATQQGDDMQSAAGEGIYD